MTGERKSGCFLLLKLQQLPRGLAVPLEFHGPMAAKQVFAPEPQEKCLGLAAAKVEEEDFAPAQGFAKLAKAAKLAGDFETVAGNSAAKQELLALKLGPQAPLELDFEF